ncbi:MAG: hypothetical protein ACI9ZV_000752 [Candidatus Azotimanducaceae bacterium]|jgi:hypothetical protein
MAQTSEKSPRVPRQGDLITPSADERDAAPLRSPRGSPRAKATPPKPAGWLAYLALILLTISCYAPIFSSELIWSEYDKVERSPYQSMASWTEAWSLDTIRGEDPITLTSYFLEEKIPLNPAVTHHAINLLLHIFAAILLLKTLEALKLPAAFSAALVFALHPSALQTIFWSGYRTELVGLVLLLAALFLGARNRNGRDFIMLVVVSAIGFIVHPATLLIPLLLGLCIFHQNAYVHLKDYNRLLPLLCLALFIGVWTQGSRSGQEFEFDFGERIGIYSQNLFFYIKQALLPVELALFHPLKQSQGYNVGAQNSLLLLLLFIPFYVLIAINFRKQWARALLLGLTAYLLLITYGLSKTGAFIDGSFAHEDRLHYIALPILTALVICAAGGIARKMGKILWCLGITVFTVLQMAVTASYAYTMSDRAQMWYNLSEQWPNTWLPKLALINIIQESGEESELLTQSEIIDRLVSILEQQPDRVELRQLLARIYRDEGQSTNALRQYKRILRDSTPDNEFLRETADFYDKLDLAWDANNARERITNETP